MTLSVGMVCFWSYNIQWRPDSETRHLTGTFSQSKNGPSHSALLHHKMIASPWRNTVSAMAV